MSHFGGGRSLLLVARGRDHFVDARYKNAAVRCDELTHEDDQVGHGLVYRASKGTRVEVACGARDSDLEVGKPAETVSQAWGTGV